MAKTTKWLDAAAKAETDECLDWPFAKNKAGYGNMYRNGRYVNAHRVMCEMANGAPYPAGAEAAHTCGNRACCNPRHLVWASHAENEAHKVEHGTRLKGSEIGNAKFHGALVRLIRAEHANGVRQATLAETYGVSRQHVSQIVNRQRWAWLD